MKHQTPFAADARLVTLNVEKQRVTYLMQGADMPQANWKVYILLNIAPVATDVTHAVLLAGL